MNMHQSPANRTSAYAALDLVTIIAIGLLLRMVLLAHLPPLVPGPLSMLLTVIAATLLLWHRGSSWHAIGLARTSSLRAFIGGSLRTYFSCMAVVVIANIVMQFFTKLPPLDVSKFAAIRGNTPLYHYMLFPVTWGAAAFGEEMLFRGFVTTRLLAIMGSDAFEARALAVIGQAALFAACHAYLGPRGVIDAGLMGVVSSTIYFRNGRNLWPLFIAHGLIDTVSLTLLYFGVGLQH
jgi:membrane protease YdiL (CAAX protease family)